MLTLFLQETSSTEELYSFVFFFILVPLSSIIVGLISWLIFYFTNYRYIKFVSRNSESIKKLREINDKYKFWDKHRNIKIEEKFSSRSKFDSYSTFSWFLVCITRKSGYYEKIYKDLTYNRELYPKYQDAVKGIVFTPINEELCKQHKLSYKKCLQQEKTIFDDIIKNPQRNIKISIKLMYSSRKKNYWKSRDDYDYELLNYAFGPLYKGDTKEITKKVKELKLEYSKTANYASEEDDIQDRRNKAEFIGWDEEEMDIEEFEEYFED